MTHIFRVALVRGLQPFTWRTLFLVILFAAAAADVAAGTKERREALAAALVRQDKDAIERAVAAINRHLGDKRGVPETPDKYSRNPVDAAMLTKAEAIAAMPRIAAEIAARRWWRVGLDPTTLQHPLREPASAIVGLLALSRAEQVISTRNTYLDAAREAGDFLLWAQAQAGTGVFPFPAAKGGVNSAAFRAQAAYLARANSKNIASQIHNGWIIEDTGDGGLQFDNGECGVAIFALYEATQDKKYLDAALRSAQWAIERPLVVNWNYVSFSVRLLARAFIVTSNQLFLDSAIQKAMLGVMPGQLTDGFNIGRWADAHNAKPTYHYIMMQSLVELVAAMRIANMDKNTNGVAIVAALRMGLHARNSDFLAPNKGANTKEAAMMALLAVNRVFDDSPDFLGATQSREALVALIKLVSVNLRIDAKRGVLPMAPGALGLMIEARAVGK